MAKRKRRGSGGGRVTPPARVWPEEESGLPPLEGIVAALEDFTQIGDRSPLEIELQVYQFLGQLGAGASPPAPAEPEPEELLTGLVERGLPHQEAAPPRAVLGLLWVFSASAP